MLPQNFDEHCTNFGRVLVPPVMTAQIQLIMTVSILLPLKRLVLRQLQEIVELNKTQYWFTIYLSMFILLHSCALLTSHEHKRAKKHGLLVCPFLIFDSVMLICYRLDISPNHMLRNCTWVQRSCLHTFTTVIKVAIPLPQGFGIREITFCFRSSTRSSLISCV